MLNDLESFLGIHARAAGIGAFGVLAGLLALAVWHDVKSRRIPNALVASGIAAGLLLQWLLPSGFGFVNSWVPGALGVLAGLEGLALGFASLFPLYLLRATGAGDVKLMAMVGAFAGPAEVLGAALLTFATGALLALAVALRQRVLRAMLHNFRIMLYGAAATFSGAGVSLFHSRTDTAAHIPYAIAIALGSCAWLLRDLVI